MSKVYDKHQSTTGIDANITAVLIYLLPLVVGMLISEIGQLLALIIPIIALFLEKKSGLVRYHAVMALLFLFARYIISVLYGFMAFFSVTSSIADLASLESFNVLQTVKVFSIVGIIMGVLIFAFEVYLMINAYKWTSVRVPLLGKWSAALSKEEK